MIRTQFPLLLPEKTETRIFLQCGGYLVDLFDYYAAGWPYFFIAFSEMIVIGYIYGIESFFADLNHMVNFKPGVWSKVHFSVIYLTVAPCSICVSWRVFYNIIFATSAIGSRSRR